MYEALKDGGWLRGESITLVQQRGAAVIKTGNCPVPCLLQKPSLRHLLWNPREFQMGVTSDGNSKGVPEDLLPYLFPVEISPGSLLKPPLPPVMISRVRKWASLQRNRKKKKNLLLNVSPLRD